MPISPEATSLTHATFEVREQLAGQLDADTLALLDRDAISLGQLPLPDALGVGVRAPEFRLPDARGGDIALSDLLASGPVVLVFYRGSWCPYCNLQLATFQSALGEIRAAGANLVAVSPQTPDASLSFAELQQLEFAVLSDAGNVVAAKFGLVVQQPAATAAKLDELGVDVPALNGEDSGQLPAPSTFVIDADGTIRFAAVSGDYRWRVGPDEVLAALRS